MRNVGGSAVVGWRIGLISEDRLLLGLLAQWLAQEDFEVIWTADSGPEALRFLGSGSVVVPDIVLVDAEAWDMDAFGLARMLAAQFTAVHVVVMSSGRDASAVAMVKADGIKGLLERPAAPKALRQALLAVVAEVSGLTDLIGSAEVFVESGGLTRRELEVLQLLWEHLGNHQIAERLVVSPHTVKRHVSSILIKLGVSNRQCAAREGARRGLVRQSLVR